ncbi:MAG: hypothetical protein DMG70_20275 [Acidobacteria bacterium]|nr:MAG: hypothetical protein DMG70_20275 [Acidobacteriota bacterium]
MRTAQGAVYMEHIVLAILLSGAAATVTDWFFGGVLFHDKHPAYPEIWRRAREAAGESKAIAWSMVLGFLTCGVFILTYSSFRLHG